MTAAVSRTERPSIFLPHVRKEQPDTAETMAMRGRPQLSMSRAELRGQPPREGSQEFLAYPSVICGTPRPYWGGSK